MQDIKIEIVIKGDKEEENEDLLKSPDVTMKKKRALRTSRGGILEFPTKVSDNNAVLDILGINNV